MADRKKEKNNISALPDDGILQVEGIFRKGGGNVPKLVMLDSTISITAKAIYAYLCTQAGNGTTSYPGRDKMIHDLKINKETYYVHMKQLVDKGYLRISRKRTSKLFEHNIYTLCVHVKSDLIENESHVDSIKAKGYGAVPRVVMYDQNLSVKAKALYAYLASYTGEGRPAYPTVPTLLYHMDITRNTYKKILTELTSAGYVVVEQVVDRGRLSHNTYTLPDIPTRPNAFPKASSKQQIKPPGSEKAPLKQKQECVKFPDMINPDIIKQDVIVPDIIEQDVINPDTTINKSTINNFTITSSINPDSPDEFEYLFKDPEYEDEDLEILWKECVGKNPKVIAKLKSIDRLKLEKMIIVNTAIDYYELPAKEQILYLVSLVASTLKYPTLKVNGIEYKAIDFVPKLLSLMVDDYEFVLERVGQTQGIKNLRAYYIACLFNAREDHMAEIDKQVRENELI